MNTHGSGLGAQIAKGTLWTVAMRWGIRMLGIVSVVILARILQPADYGIVAQASMIYSFLELMTGFGLENALIRDQKASRVHYDTVWTLLILRGVAIALTLCILAYPAAQFFRQPELQGVIYAFAGLSFLEGLINVGVVDFRKQLRFDLDFRFNLFRRIAGFLVTVAWAYHFHSYWAFVAGSLASAAVGVWLSFSMSAFRPGITLAEWRSLFEFSKWMLGYQLIGTLSSKLDTFILSRMSTTELLGLYTVSQEVAGAASTEIAMPVARAMLPGLAAVNDDLEEFRSLYVKTLSIVLAIAFPAALGISALSELATAVLLGEKWAAAAPIIFLLSFAGIGRIFGSLSTSAYISFGRVDIMTKLSVINLAVVATALGCGYYFFQFWGLIWGVLITSALNSCISIGVQAVIGQLVLKELFRQVWRVVAAGLTMWFVLLEFPIVTGFGSVADLIVSVLAGAAIYFAGIAALWSISRPTNGPEREILGYLRPRLASWLRKPSGR